MLPFKLREPRNALLLLSYLGASSLLELAIVHYGFRTAGLEDTYVIWRLGLWTFFIPLAVVLVLTASWLHLTRSFLVAPRGAKPRRKGKRKKGLTIEARLARRMGYLGLSAVRSTGLILLVLGIAAAVALLTFYWAEAYELSGRLLAFPPFFWLIRGLRWLADKMWAVEKLRKALEKLVDFSIKANRAIRPLAEAVRDSDPLYKYAFVQNAVAWTSGLSAMLYRRPPVMRRR